MDIVHLDYKLQRKSSINFNYIFYFFTRRRRRRRRRVNGHKLNLRTYVCIRIAKKIIIAVKK